MRSQKLDFYFEIEARASYVSDLGCAIGIVSDKSSETGEPRDLPFSFRSVRLSNVMFGQRCVMLLRSQNFFTRRTTNKKATKIKQKNKEHVPGRSPAQSHIPKIPAIAHRSSFADREPLLSIQSGQFPEQRASINVRERHG